MSFVTAIPLDAPLVVANVTVLNGDSGQMAAITLDLKPGEDACWTFEQASESLTDNSKAVLFEALKTALVQIQGPRPVEARHPEDGFGRQFLLALNSLQTSAALYRLEQAFAKELLEFEQVWKEDRVDILSLQATQVQELMDANEPDALSSVVEEHVRTLAEHDACYESAQNELFQGMRAKLRDAIMQYTSKMPVSNDRSRVPSLVGNYPSSNVITQTANKPSLLQLLSSNGHADLEWGKHLLGGDNALPRLDSDWRASRSFVVYLGSQLKERYQVSVIIQRPDMFINSLAAGVDRWRNHLKDLYQSFNLTAVVAPAFTSTNDAIALAQKQSPEVHFAHGSNLVSNVLGVHAIVREPDVTAAIMLVSDKLCSVSKVVLLARGWVSDEELAKRLKEGLMYNARRKMFNGSTLAQVVVVVAPADHSASSTSNLSDAAIVEKMLTVLSNVLGA